MWKQVLIDIHFNREMTMRHVTTKLKPQLADHITSWKNYVQVSCNMYSITLRLSVLSFIIAVTAFRDGPADQGGRLVPHHTVGV